MSAAMNRQVLLKSRPTGIPQAENFEIADAPMPDIGDRQFLVRVRVELPAGAMVLYDS